MIQFKVKNSTLKKGFFCLFVPTVLFHNQLTAQPAGYTYGRSITIQGSQVTGSLSSFPVLSITPEYTALALCTILPIKISSFVATPASNGVVTISWTAEQENASDKYLVERSVNGNNWETFKTITATGNAGPQKYTTLDLNPVFPVTYYRIQQVEANNTITYTQIISAKLNGDAFNNKSFIVSPNPARQLIQLAFPDNVLSQQTRVELMNNMGVKVHVQPAFNGNTISLTLPQLATGAYFLNVYLKDIKHTRKILINQ